MEIRNIRTFLRVAELQSFTGAADQLGYSQAAVTVQIKQLEEELGTQLFDRIGKRIKLTPHGVRFMTYAAKVLNAAEEARNFAKEKENLTGTLRIGSTASLSMEVLLPVLMEFKEVCPLVETSIETSGHMTELIDMIRHNDVDLLYFLDRRLYLPEWIKVMERSELITFVTHSNHPFAGRESVPVEELLKEPFLLTTRGVSYCDELEQALAERNLEIHPFLEMGDTEVIVQMLRRGAGVSFLPLYSVQKYIDKGELAAVVTDLPQIRSWSQLVHHKNKWITPQMKIFVNLMKKHLNAGLAEEA